MKKQLIAAAAASLLALAAGTASAAETFLDFTVNEGSIPGKIANSFVADKLNGGYNEVLTINPDFSFTTTAYANFGSFFRNDGTQQVTTTQLNNFVGGYGLYAIFTSQGQFNGGNFTGASGAFSLYIDTNNNTTFANGTNGNTLPTLGNNADDYLIATSSVLQSGVGIPGVPGAFNLFFSQFQLTTGDQSAAFAGNQNGEGFFSAPRPFHMVVNVNGDFDQFDIAPGSFAVTGDVSAVFVVPEPGSLALVGLGLAALGLTARRRKQA